MKKLFTFILACTLFAGLAAVPSITLAADKPTPEEIFKKLDTNGDGKLSLEEFKASKRAQKDPDKAEAMFKKLDTNNDGFLSLEEFKAGMMKKSDSK